MSIIRDVHIPIIWNIICPSLVIGINVSSQKCATYLTIAFSTSKNNMRICKLSRTI